jgi:hypothetical protein
VRGASEVESPLTDLARGVESIDDDIGRAGRGRRKGQRQAGPRRQYELWICWTHVGFLSDFMVLVC